MKFLWKWRGTRAGRKFFSLLLAGAMALTLLPIPAHAAEASGDLTLNEDQAKAVEALGFSTEQPERYTPSGQLVDRTKSPFGVNKVTQFGVKQLFVSWPGTSYLYQTANDSPGFKTATYQATPIAGGGIHMPDLGSAKERVSVAADIDGDGKDETVIAFWSPDAGMLFGKVGIALTQYTPVEEKGKTEIRPTTTVYDRVGSETTMFAFPSPNDYDRNIFAVSGDFDHDGVDEIAIGRGDTLSLCRIDEKSLTVLSTLRLDGTSMSYLAMVESGNFGGVKKAIKVNAMLAADLDDDGFAELFVTAGRDYISKAAGDTDSDIDDYEKGVRSYLMIFRSTADLNTLSAPTVELTATAGENAVYIDNPGLDMGNIFGDGENELVIGGRLFGRKDDNNVGLTTLHYDPETDAYQTGLKDNRLYTFVTNDFKAVQNKPGVKCVN
jgi:hypothetical protein